VAEKDKVAKTTLYSPVHGIIKQINVSTIGGVVRSGMDLIEIVPQSKILLVEAKISPKDIAFINPKQKAIVKITAYDFSIYGGLDGKIVEISADSIIDKDSKDQASYYKVVVKTDKNYLEKDGEQLPIIPGMVASVDIVTGKKTILDFLLKPILKTKGNAFHER
ncbi:secretion protein HylD, partial [Arcobacter sp. 31_11_sub10_T18]